MCGDGLVNRSFTPILAPGVEQYDDGNVTAGDGCSALCQIETCGNGITETINAQQCDDGNTDDLDGCRNNCQLARCGDGVKSASEVCDTGGNSATCDFDCNVPQCGGGDGIVNLAAGEQCDDNNAVVGDGCNQCHLETCGNGLLEPGEVCDDGGTSVGDGCSATCTVEAGYTCIGTPSVCTLLTDNEPTNNTCDGATLRSLPATVMSLQLPTVADVDWFTFQPTAGDVGKVLHVVTSSSSSPACDTVVEVLSGASCGALTSLGGQSDDANYSEDWRSTPIPSTAPLYVRVSYSSFGFSSADYSLSVTVE